MKLLWRLTHGGVSASGVMLYVGRNNCLSQAAIIEDGNMSKYLSLIVVAGVLFATPPANAQQADYPNRPIKIIVCLPPGGGVDTVTRIVSDKLQRRLGQPIVIENKGGQAGNLGAEAVWSSEPDGYTLLASQPAPITTNPMLYKNLSFDPALFMPVAIG